MANDGESDRVLHEKTKPRVQQYKPYKRDYMVLHNWMNLTPQEIINSDPDLRLIYMLRYHAGIGYIDIPHEYQNRILGEVENDLVNIFKERIKLEKDYDEEKGKVDTDIHACIVCRRSIFGNCGDPDI